MTGCGGCPSYATPQQAIEGFHKVDAAIDQEVPDGKNRAVLFRSQRHQDPQVVLVEDAGWGRWQADILVSNPLRNIGMVSLQQKTVGQVEKKAKPPAIYRDIYPKTLVFYGVVNDSQITWVEVTLPEKPGAPKRVQVVNGTWLIIGPWEIGFPPSPGLRCGPETRAVSCFPFPTCRLRPEAESVRFAADFPRHSQPNAPWISIGYSQDPGKIAVKPDVID